MTLKHYLRFSWVPILLTFTLYFTFFEQENEFDFVLLSAVLIVASGHFYITHWIAAKYFKVHNPFILEYWKAASLSYIPLISSFWIAALFYGNIHNTIDLNSSSLLVLGLIGTLIMFPILILKKIKMDLDAVMALMLIIALVGAISIWILFWLVLQFDFLFY